MIGQTISHYRIIKKIDEGGMGEIYLADDLQLKRKTALKFLKNFNALTDAEKSRFINEAQSAAILNHPNICTVYEINEEVDKPFIAMEYVDGITVKDKINSSELSLGTCVSIIKKIAQGLKEASRKNIVHRDIKSENILISKKGEVKITDFGVAKIKNVPNTTKSNSIMGTISHMSPEQLMGKFIDSRTDIWSLGVLFYQMLTKELPFRGNEDQALIYSILNEDPKPIENTSTIFPEKLKQIILKMLEKDASERYQNFDELIFDIEQFCDSSQLTPTSKVLLKSFDKTNKSRIKYGVSFFLITACIITFFVFFNGDKGSEKIRLLVFPFETLGNENDSLITAGMYYDLVSRISQISGLNVLSPQNALKYSSKLNKSDLLKQDNIEYWVEGNVQFTNLGTKRQIKTTVNLINSDDVLIWSDQHISSMDNIFEMYEAIAENVAKNLDVKILEPEREKIGTRPTNNPEAYQLMLKASEINRKTQSYQSRKMRIDGYNSAIKLREDAVKLDPNYYSALHRLSFGHSYMYHFGFDKTLERKQKARSTFLRAKNLDPNNIMTKHLEATHTYRIEGNYKKCYELLKEIREEEPNKGHLWMGIVERRLGLWDKAIKNIREHNSKHPYDSDGPLVLGYVYTLLRKYKLADQLYDQSFRNQKGFIYPLREKSRNYILWSGDILSAKNVWNISDDSLSTEKDYYWLELYRFERNYENLKELINSYEDNYVMGFTQCFLRQKELSLCYYLLNNNEQRKLFADSALYILNEELVKNPVDPVLHSTLGIAYALNENKIKALTHSNRAIELWPITYDAIDGAVYLFNQAIVFSILDMKKEAIDNLSMLMSVPSEVSAPYLRVDPLWDNLREEEGFKKLTSKK